MAYDPEWAKEQEAYESGKMAPEQRAAFEREYGLSSGVSGVTTSFDPSARGVPPGFGPPAPQPQAVPAAPQPVSTVPGPPAPQPQEIAPPAPEDPAEQLPSVMRMPEYWKRIYGTASANPDEVAQIFQSAYPDIKVEKKPSGYVTFERPTGEKYVLSPNRKAEDLARFAVVLGGTAAAASALGAVAPMLLPAGLVARGAAVASQFPRLAKVAGWAAAGARDADLIEGAQALAGGTYDMDSLGAGAAMGVAVPAALAAGGATARGVVNRLMPGVRAAVPQQSTADLAVRMAQAGKGVPGALEDVAATVKPNQEISAALENFNGLQNKLTPGMVTDNPMLQQIEGAFAAPTTGSPSADKFKRAVGAAESEVLGTVRAGERPISTTSAFLNIDEGVGIAADREAARQAFEKINATPGLLRAATPAPEALDLIGRLETNKVVEGALTKGEEYTTSPMMDWVKGMLSPREVPTGFPRDPITGKIPTIIEQPTYDRIDTVMRRLGEAASKKGEFGGDANQALAARLAELVDLARMRTAKEFGQDAALEAAQKKVSDRFARQMRKTAMFGVDGSESLTPKILSAFERLGAADETPLENLVKAIPKERRESVLRAGLAEFLSDAPIEKFNALWGKLEAHPVGKNAFLANLPQGTGATLDALFKITGPVGRSKTATALAEAAMKAAPSAREEVADALFDAAKLGTTFWLPWRQAGTARVILASLQNPRDRGVIAAKQLLESQEAQALFKGLASLRKPSLGWVERNVKAVTDSRAFKQFSSLVEGPVDKAKWFRQMVEQKTGVRRSNAQLVGHATSALRSMNQQREDMK